MKSPLKDQDWRDYFWSSNVMVAIPSEAIVCKGVPSKTSSAVHDLRCLKDILPNTYKIVGCRQLTADHTEMYGFCLVLF